MKTKEQRREAARQWRAAHPGYSREYMKKWSAANRERMREHEAKWRAANREKRRAGAKTLYAKTKRRRASQIEKWREANPDKVKAARARHQSSEKRRETARRYRVTHKDLLHASYHRHQAKRRGNGGTHTGVERTALFTSYQGLCVYCLGRATVADHVNPLSLGGRNDIDNLAPACARCNTSKGATPVLVWLAKRRRA